MNLLQGVIEKVTGILFEDYLRKNVWIPAAMMSTGFDLPERIVPHRAKGYLRSKGRIINNPYGDLSYKFASGGMISTVEDLVRFGMALNHVRLLQPETTAIMYQPQLKTVYRYQPNGPPVRENFEQGLIWRMQKDSGGRIFAYHCGTVKGFNACLVNYFGEDLVVRNCRQYGGHRISSGAPIRRVLSRRQAKSSKLPLRSLFDCWQSESLDYYLP